MGAQSTHVGRHRDLSRGRQVPGVFHILLSPERLYLVAVALSGCAAVGSVALPAAQRGTLAATVVSATLGAAIGGFSIDTFLLSRPAGWVARSGRVWIFALLGGCVVLSAAAAALLTAAAQLGSYPVAMAGAGVLTVFNALASLILRLKRFVHVYSMRAAGGAALVGGYALLYLWHRLDGVEWAYVWLAAQVVAALGLGGEVLVRARRFMAAVVASDPQVAAPMPAVELSALTMQTVELPVLMRQTAALPVPAAPVPAMTVAPAGPRVRRDLADIAKLHAGICAQMLTFRLDQVLLARFTGAGPLGVYALAVSALEFAQSGAVVTAQKILSDRGPSTRRPSAVPVLKAALPIAVAAVAGLAVVGWLVPPYRRAWVLGLLLLPGCLAVSVGKAWSASLLKLRGERTTTIVAIQTLAVSVPCYFVLVPWIGATGAALASSFVYAVQAIGSRLRLRDTAVAPLSRVAV